MLAIVAPGQGSQKPGFLKTWLADPNSESQLNSLAKSAGLDLAHWGTDADEETIRDTAVAQPLLVAAGLLSIQALFPDPAEAGQSIGVTAGHSVGELTAAAIAGVISPEQAMILVRERGQSMAQASALQQTSMTAVLRGDPDEVLAAIAAAGLVAANHNGSGQIVAAGTVEQLHAFAEQPPPGARLVPLSVAGAFHSEHMAAPMRHLAGLAEGVRTNKAQVPVLSNADGAALTDGEEVIARIVSQVANPVRWDRCMATMIEMGVTGLLEVPPAGTLTGLAKRNMPGVETFALNTPDQLDDARAFVRTHRNPSVH